MAVSFAEFGVNDRKLYNLYLRTFDKVYDGGVRDGYKFNFGRSPVHHCIMGTFGGSCVRCGSISVDALWRCGTEDKVVAGLVDGGSDVGSLGERGGCTDVIEKCDSGSRGLDTSSGGSNDRFVGAGVGQTGSGQSKEGVGGTPCVNLCLGKNTERNRCWRQEKKERKIRKQVRQGKLNLGVPEWRQHARAVGVDSKDRQKVDFVDGDRVKYGYFSELSSDKRQALRESRAARLEAENRLQQAKSERALELLKASDIEKEKKMNETRVMRNTELNKVKVEQAFARLSATGNVPGFAETVVSGVPTLSSGSISPNSSISAAEVHAMQKELLELQLRDKEYNKLKESIKEHVSESVYDSLVGKPAKTVETSFTADTLGHELASGGGFHYCDDGRYRAGERFDYW